MRLLEDPSVSWLASGTGRKGNAHEECEAGQVSEAEWQRVEVPASACPRISPDFLAEERRTLGPWWFAQEYDCAFMEAQTQAFRREDVERAFAEEVQAWEV